MVYSTHKYRAYAHIKITKLGFIMEELKLSVCSTCPMQKLAYEKCFQKWYAESYLKNPMIETMGCSAEWNAYQLCMQGAIKERGLEHDLKTIEQAREKERKEMMENRDKKEKIGSMTELYVFPSSQVTAQNAKDNVNKANADKIQKSTGSSCKTS